MENFTSMQTQRVILDLPRVFQGNLFWFCATWVFSILCQFQLLFSIFPTSISVTLVFLINQRISFTFNQLYQKVHKICRRFFFQILRIKYSSAGLCSTCPLFATSLCQFLCCMQMTVLIQPIPPILPPSTSSATELSWKAVLGAMRVL